MKNIPLAFALISSFLSYHVAAQRVVLKAGPNQEVPVDMNDFITALKQNPVDFVTGLGEMIEMMVGPNGVSSLGLTDDQKTELFASIKQLLIQLEVAAAPVMQSMTLSDSQKESIEQGMNRLRQQANVSDLDVDLDLLEKILTKSV